MNLLAHEAQIAADKRAFKDLPAWRLEDRAKLAELAAARATTARVLTAFEHNQGDDPQEPHSYTDRRVLRELAQGTQEQGDADLMQLDPGTVAVAVAAATLLRRDTGDLQDQTRRATR